MPSTWRSVRQSSPYRLARGENNWKNYERKALQQRLKSETARFGVVIKWIARLEFITIFLSIDFVLRLCRFSADFRNRMVYPLVALFFGTGNQTPKVSAAIIARVFRDPSLALFEYDPVSGARCELGREGVKPVALTCHTSVLVASRSTC